MNLPNKLTMSRIIMSILIMILLLSLLILVHEAGHFIAARAFGIKVEKFEVDKRNRYYVSVDDVLYTYNDIVFKGLGNTATRDAMMIDGELPKLEKVSDDTVRFTTSKPFAPFLRQLTYPIVPKHYFKKYSDLGESEFNSFLNPNTNPKDIVSVEHFY